MAELQIGVANSQRKLIWAAVIDPVTTMDAATWVDTSRELEQMGWDVALLGVGDTDTVKTVRGTDVHCFSTPDVYFVRKLLFHAKVVRFILQNWRDADVVMFHQISSFWLLPLKFLRLFKSGKKTLFVMDTRDLPDYEEGNLKVQLHLRSYWFAHWLANHLADFQIAITDKMAEMVNIPQKQLTGTWPSGVEIEKFSPYISMRQWPQEGEPIKLIYIGSLLKKRNPVALGEAVIAANQNGMKFELLMYGSGAERPALEALAARANGAIKLNDPVPHDQVPKLLAGAHIGVTSLPEIDDVKYQASSPVKLFEYMAVGLPMLATRNYCHTEVVGNGRYTFWIDAPTPENIQTALSQIWNSRESLPHLSHLATEEASNWSWRGAAAKLKKALDKAVDTT